MARRRFTGAFSGNEKYLFGNSYLLGKRVTSNSLPVADRMIQNKWFKEVRSKHTDSRKNYLTACLLIRVALDVWHNSRSVKERVDPPYPLTLVDNDDDINKFIGLHA